MKKIFLPLLCLVISTAISAQTSVPVFKPMNSQPSVSPMKNWGACGDFVYVTGNRTGSPAGFTEFYGEYYDGKSWQSLPTVNFKGSSGQLVYYNKTVYMLGNFTDVLGHQPAAGKFTFVIQLKGSAWDTVNNGDVPNALSTASVKTINSGIYFLEKIVVDSTHLHRFLPGQGIVSKRSIAIDTSWKGSDNITMVGEGDVLFIHGNMKGFDGTTAVDWARLVKDSYVSTSLSGIGYIIRAGVDFNGDIYYCRSNGNIGPYKLSGTTNTNVKYNLFFIMLGYILPRNGEIMFGPAAQNSSGNYDFYFDKVGTYWYKTKMSTGNYGIVVSNKLGYFVVDMAASIWKELTLEPGGTVSGRMYADLDKNCSFNSTNDTLLRNTVVTLKSKTDEYSTMTDKNGKYFMVLPLDSFVYKQTNPDFMLNTCSKKYVVTDTSSSDTVDISVYPKCADDLEVNLIAGGSRLDDVSHNSIRIRNKGLKTRNALLTLNYDAKQVYVGSNFTPLTNTSGTLSWRFKNIKPLTEIILKVQLEVPFDSFKLGDWINLYVKLDTMSAECDTLNNRDSFRQKVVYSYDPNSKSSDKDGNVYWGLKKIKYYIQFQNEGNDYARNVVVQDTLPSQIRPEGIEFLGSSHPCKMTLINGVFTFTFADIMLQPKSVNEPLSKGWISFEADVDPGLPVGTNIKNKAQIYFDRNPAVVTNYSSVLIVNYPASRKNIGSTTELSLYPNPAQNSFTVVNPLNRELILELFDLNGRKLMDQVLKAGQADEINIATLPTGLYILKSPLGSQKVFKM